MRIWGGFRAFTSSLWALISESAEDPLNRSARRAVVGIGLTLALGFIPLFGQGRGEIPGLSSIPDPKFQRLIVAHVGPWDITGAEFQMGYDFGPAFVKREKDSKERYLNFLINEKLLALDAERRGLEQWPDLKRQVAEIEGDLATEELYKQDVLSKVRLTSKELAAGIRDAKVHLSLRWLFCRTAAQVDSLVAAMKHGVPFDTLFAAQLESGVKSEDRSMEDVTRFRLKIKNPAFASVVDTMGRRETSLPIHGPDGWYIVRMDNAWTNPVVTQTDEEKLEHDVRTVLGQQQADSLSDVYVRRAVSAENPVILRGPFNALQVYLGTKFLPADSVEDWKLKDREGARELKDVRDLSLLGGNTLVQLRSKDLTVREFLDWYRMREPYITLELATPQGFFHSVEDLVWRMVRDRLLTRKAYARGLQKLPAVRQQTQWWKEKMLYTAAKNRIADTITDSLPLVREYFAANQRSFVDEHGKVKSFEEVRDDVWRQYYDSELTKRLFHEIIRLKKEYKVQVEKSALDRIPVDEQDNPRAIDVYTVKTRGIYPRTAFPSIDYYWQSWN